MADRISYAAKLRGWASDYEDSAMSFDVTRHSAERLREDAAMCRELAALVERAEKVAEISMNPLLLALAAGFDPQRAGAREGR